MPHSGRGEEATVPRLDVGDDDRPEVAVRTVQLSRALPWTTRQLHVSTTWHGDAVEPLVALDGDGQPFARLTPDEARALAAALLAAVEE